MTEKGNNKRTAAGGRSRRQKKQCANEGLGRGSGRNCTYRRHTGSVEVRLQSLVAALFDGLDNIIERTRTTVALLSSRTDSKRYSNTISEKPLLADAPSDDCGEKRDKSVAQRADRK